MRIYFLLPKLLDPARQRVSGGTISNLRMMEHLADSAQVVCVPMVSTHVPDSLENRHGLLIELPNKMGAGRFRYASERYCAYPKRLRRSIEKHGPGVLVGTRAMIPVAHKASSELGLPFVIITRAFEDLEQSGLRQPSARMTLFRRLDGVINRSKILRAYRAASLLVTNSEFMKREHERLFATTADWFVSYPAIDLPRCEPTASNIKTIGFVNKGAKKGLDLVLELAARFPEKTFRVYGVPLPGDTSRLSNLKNIGYTSDRAKMFRETDLFLVPSVWDEPYGRVAAEALWSGQPVIVSKKGGLPEAAPNELFWANSLAPAYWEQKLHTFCNPALHSKLIHAVRSAQDKLASRGEPLVDALGKIQKGRPIHLPGR